MSVLAGQPLQVTIQDLSPILVAFTSCHLQQLAGSYSDQIREGFDRIKDWARGRGYDPAALRVIGIPQVDGAQLVGYDCAVELPETASLDTGDIRTRRLAGGRYAILSLEKDSATIGETIGRFFAEYVPQRQLVVDPQRPSYEVYYERVMDYCVPLR